MLQRKEKKNKKIEKSFKPKNPLSPSLAARQQPLALADRGEQVLWFRAFEKQLCWWVKAPWKRHCLLLKSPTRPIWSHSDVPPRLMPLKLMELYRCEMPGATTGAGSPLSALQKEEKINMGICTKSWGIHWWGRGAEKCRETLRKDKSYPLQCVLQLSEGADWVGERLLQESPEQAEVQRGIAKNPGPALTPAGRTQLYTPKTGTNNTGKESPNDKKKNTTVTRRRVGRGKQCSA